VGTVHNKVRCADAASAVVARVLAVGQRRHVFLSANQHIDWTLDAGESHMTSTEDEARVRIIVNGKSAGDPALRHAVGELRSRGREIEVRVTWEAGDAARLAGEAVSHQIGTVIAAGGDGTINEVVTGMLEADPQPSTNLGLLPYGTANDFATGLGIPRGDPLAALEMQMQATPQQIDAGKVNDRYFVNVATGGFGAEVTASTPIKMKNTLGGAAYSLMGLIMAAKMSSWRIKVTSGEIQEEGEMIVLAIGNGRQAGGGYQLAPHANLDDGLLDLLVVHDVELARIGEVLTELNDLRNPDNHFVHYVQLEAFKIEAEQTIQLNLDGEPLRDVSFDCSVLPGCLRLLNPRTANP
jgi:lipid kinase YegS